MQVERIPAELKARPQWVVWRSIINEGKVTKPPFQASNPNNAASVTDPSHWATFETAMQTAAANPSVVQGVGFVFTDDDPYFGIDIDDEAKVAPEHKEHRAYMVKMIMERCQTYAEVSPSGKGLHIIGRGRLPADGRRSTQLQIEIYANRRYLTFTGDTIPGHEELRDSQDLADFMFTNYYNNTQPQEHLGDITTNRRLDLTDEEVVRQATNYHPSFAARFNCQTGCAPGEWSETFMMIMGVLDQITGRVEQIQRIVFNSPMVTMAPASAAGEPRLAKAQRNFNHVLNRVRTNNTPQMQRVEHGRQVYEAMQQAKAERAKAIVEAILAKSEDGFSANGIQLMKAFPVKPEYLDLTAPPGIVGEFVQSTMRAMFNPFLKFALPATLATLSGIVGRSYKLPGGAGLNANFILAAPTATGKTQTMGAWEAFLGRAARAIDNTVSGASRPRIIKGSAGSIQGIFEDFMQTPSAVWFISECHSQLQQMSKPRSTVDAQLRDAFNDLFDSSMLGRFMSPPRSVANKKANLTPIENLSISTFWTTTTSKFEVFAEDAQDGFLSRVIIIRHLDAAGDVIPVWELQRDLPDDLNIILVNLLATAKRYDETYDLSAHEAARLITTVATEQVDSQAWAFQQISERIKNAALAGSIPIPYTAVSRLPPLALRLAAVLAVVENCYTPAVTLEQYEWAFGYLLQNMAQTLSDMDTGKVGATMAQDVEVVIREFKRLLKKHRPADNCLNSSMLSASLRQLKPFKEERNPGDSAQRTIARMVEDGLLDKHTPQIEGRGRPALKYSPSNDSAWRS
jgi:hypothetical protein